MEMNNKLCVTAIIIYLIWFGIHFMLSDLLKIFHSYLLFRVRKCAKLGKAYKFMYQKKYNEQNESYISCLSVKLNTYLNKYKYRNKSSIDTIVTIIMTTLLTLTMTSYTIQSQNNKEFVTFISKNLGNDFATAMFLVMGVYGIKAIFHEFIISKVEYYLMIKNIIDEIEKEKKVENQKEIENFKQKQNEQLISELKEIQKLLKDNNEDKAIIKKACNKIIDNIF